MTIQAKREELRQRVEASRGRFPPEPAEENEPLLADKVGEVAKQYPLALLGGALLVGLMLGLSGKRDEGEPRAIDKFDKKLSQILVDFLFAAGIGLLQDVSKSKVFDE